MTKKKDDAISQMKYILDKPAKTSMDLTKKIKITTKNIPIDKDRCQHLMCKLIYLFSPIGLLVLVISQYMNITI